MSWSLGLTVWILSVWTKCFILTDYWACFIIMWNCMENIKHFRHRPLCASLNDDIITVAHSWASRSQRKLKLIRSWGGVAKLSSWHFGDFTSYFTIFKLNSATVWWKRGRESESMIKRGRRKTGRSNESGPDIYDSLCLVSWRCSLFSSKLEHTDKNTDTMWC